MDVFTGEIENNLRSRLFVRDGLLQDYCNKKNQVKSITDVKLFLISPPRPLQKTCENYLPAKAIR